LRCVSVERQLEVRLDDLWTEGMKGGMVMRFVTNGGVRLCFILGAVVLLGAGPAWSQSVTEGKLTGTVYLPTGEALAGATARVVSDALVRGEQTVVSGEGGRFVFLSLPSGSYDLTVSLDGFKTFTQEGITITRGTTFDVEVNMEIGAIEDVITVTAETPIINKHSATIDTTFSNTLLEVVPTARESFYDLALTAPGMANVGAQGEKGWLNSPSAFGSSGNENIFLVNGVDTTNPRGAAYGPLVNVNYNTVEEVKVLSLGSRAEYGSFSGAAMDVITKSGGNEFHGDVAYYSQLGRADDNQDPFPECGEQTGFICAVNANDLSTRIEDSWEANATLGGPIKKDWLWFYAGFARIDSETDTPLFIPLQGYESDLIDIKLTSALGASHRLWIAYHNEDNANSNQSWGDTWDPEMAFLQQTENDTYSAQYQWVVSDSNLFSFKYLGFDTEENPSTNLWDHPGYVNWWKFVGSQDVGVAGGFPYVEKQIADRSTIQVDFSHYADDFLGEHDIKFGVQYTEAEGNWQGGYFHNVFNYAYPYPYQNSTLARDWWWNCDATWCWGTDEDPLVAWYNIRTESPPFLTVRKSDSTGVFVDDTWIVSDRVTLNLGLRYDKMTAKYGEGAVYEPYDGPGSIENPTFVESRPGSGDLYDFETWAPRLGINWVLTEDGKTVLRSHLGRYFAPVGIESLTRFGPNMPLRQRYYEWYDIMLWEVDLNDNGYLDSEEVWPGTRLLQGRDPQWVRDEGLHDSSWDFQVAPGTDSPYTDQFSLSIQRQIGRDIGLELSYVYKKTDHRPADPGVADRASGL
jgi:outer membrane receptor protein involved in Fe transport